MKGPSVLRCIFDQGKSQEENSFISYLVPTYNNLGQLEATLRSIDRDRGEFDQIIVVDSGDMHQSSVVIEKTIPTMRGIVHVWERPGGVYPALNRGLREAQGEWIQVINSGDQSIRGSREILEAVIQSTTINMHVFSQLTSHEGKIIGRFTPQPRGIWPHQSVVIRRNVHSRLGGYREDLKFVSDQIFFSLARQSENFRIYEEAITIYDLDGMSSNPTWNLSQELYLLHRSLGKNRCQALGKAYLRPLAKLMLGKLMGKGVSNIFANYVNKKSVGK